MIRLFNFRLFWAILTVSLLAVTPVLTSAGPGAHGPNGEHLDSPTMGNANSIRAGFRVEANSDLFELVATLAGGELSILIDRFATNEPVLRAQVEVESGGLKAQAKFHEDIGDYSIDDPAMLKKLSSPGEHPLVITVLTGEDSDLLDGVLRVPTSSADHEHGIHWAWLVLGALIIFALLGVAAALVHKKRQRQFSEGGRV